MSVYFFPKERFDDLQLIPDYIVSRIWPRRYPELENALINFKNIANDIMFVYYKYPDGDGDGVGGYRTEKFYRRYYRENYRDQEKWSFEEENRQLEKYKYHLALLEDLVLELTRAANYICDFVREYIFEGFRLEEGVLLVMRGDFLSHQTFRVEYRGVERTDRPYPGLRRFMEIREERDFQIGEGVEEDYFVKMPWE